ncbi:MAG: ABC transporter ATP-binding protein/permease [Gammaproteobacteria bacterium]|nr:ABC transporter ATP-binding protein/permease [Gammaproteobacteria bacterium]
MIESFPAAHSVRMRYSQLLSFITPRRHRLWLVVILLLAVAATNLANPLFAGKLTEVLLAESGSTELSAGFILIAWLILLVVRAALGMSSSYVIGTTGALMSAELRSRVYEHMQILPLAWFQQRKQGDVLSLLSNDAESISRFVTDTVVQLLPQLLTLTLAFLVLASLDPMIAGIAALLLPAYTIVTRLLGRRIRPLSTAWIKTWSGLVAFVNENIGMMPALKAFARESRESDRFASRNLDLLEVSRQQIWLNSLLAPAIGLLTGAGALLLLWVGIRHVQSGQLQPSELVTILLYVMLMTGPLSALARVYGQIMFARGAADRLLEFFGERPEPLGHGKTELSNVKGQIEFCGVSFAYADRPALLKRFNLTIDAGETIALTGPNGAGKSTLVHLLMRFMEPQAGHILIDGQDIGTADLGSLRRQIGLVSQRTLLLNGSVADNIGYGQPGAGPQEVRTAARLAGAVDFIEKLPEGYKTRIGDQGIRLSGGQRQRLSLARAMLKDPPILVLDEATVMFDRESEQEFVQTFREQLNQRTVILITHSTAIQALADRVLVIGGPSE